MKQAKKSSKHSVSTEAKESSHTNDKQDKKVEEEDPQQNHIFSGKGQDKKGRWSWVTLHRRTNKKITIDCIGI